MSLPTLLVTFALIVASSAAAQSLGELGKNERERRARQAKASRVIRTEDIRALDRGKVTHGALRPPTLESSIQSPETVKQAETIPGPSRPVPDEIYWRTLFREARLQLELNQNQALVRELRINEFRNRFLTESDGSARSMIEQELSRLLLENEAGEEAIRRSEGNLKTLEEKARKENVPSSWTREEIADQPPR